jgi:hypothetical protein
MQYPYNDEYMTFDEQRNQYVLTQKFVFEQIGIDLCEQANERNAVSSNAMAQRFLRTVSNAVYNYIHKHNADNQMQDFIIAKCPSMRNIIQEAMAAQLLYMRMNGALDYVADETKQGLYVCPACVAELERTIPELGYSILYTGRI